MHPRNPYRDPKRLLWLAEKDTELAKYINKNDKNASVNWDDDQVKRAVSEAILRHDFGMDVSLLPDRLCPSVPNRLNYVLWVEDLVHSLHWYDCQDPSYARGIDIGTGSIAIYACLACKRNPLWSIVGTDIDADAIEHANKTLDRNVSRHEEAKAPNTTQIRSRIRLIHTHGSYLDRLRLDKQCTEGHESRRKVVYHFSMCNPPFYASQEERQESSNKKQVAKTWTAGSQHELYTPGGELAFILRLFEESQQWREQVV
ncbi:23S rRNA (adenine(1618)-N(6))-methyltransferase [Malassezia yamatoensis]|uniref:23S rRNA (Adenine(1618)-N(6))-methyltransferase n=1 Tax=Malassezia yamatoensis TaxID=253288 RepID=A0AAJ5YVX6_9BASI|nr:23S rRNA (adenine(1618)-N(6))-methyltransferase [Malassezia yamatoensis]